MVMARSSVHRRDDTLDSVQFVPKLDRIILVFTTIIQEICQLVLTAIRAVLNESKFASNFPICPKS